MNKTLKYVLQSILKAVSLIVAVSILTFVLAELSPIDPIRAYVGAESGVSQEQQALIAERWGLNEPPVTRFCKWGNALIHGDFGDSQLYHRPVLEVIKLAAGNSFILMSVSWILSGIFGFLLGILAAAYRDRWLDKAVRTFCYILSSTPTFWVGIIFLLVFSVSLGWFPIGMSTPIGAINSDVSILEKIHHMILPALTLSITGVASLAMYTREEMVKVFNSEYALFAKARGESTGEIIKRHGLRNILLPAVTIQFASLSELFGGSVLAENVFSYAGLGGVTLEAGVKGDLPLLLGITIITSVVVFLGNMIANLLYPVIDPRIKEGIHGI
ncbi:MAG: ABC transporter permease [Eubacterium sp.]|nr:ABC transporter permease [Eubacterium sp.]